MEKCKYCQEELAEGSTVCPHCGKDNAAEEIPAETAAEAPAAEAVETAPAEEPAAVPAAEEAAVQPEASAEIKEGVKATPGKIAVAVAAVIVLLAALIALIVSGIGGSGTEETAAAESAEVTEATVVATIPADGNPDDVTCKGSYTVTDEEAAAAMDTVVATIGDQSLTNGQLQVYYWSVVNSFLNSDYGYYMMAYGLLDYTQPLDTQLSYEVEGQTWQQYFLQEALDYWQMNQALTNEAQAAGLEMSAEEREYLDNLATSLAETAAYYGMESVDELLLHNVGPGADLEDFTYFQELYYTGKPYYSAATEKFVPTQEELEAFFAEHETEYAEGGITKDGKYVDVRHILVAVEGGTTDEEGNTVYSEEEWAACQAEAQAILDEWLAGEATENSFAALANEKSEDPGSNTNGGLYENVYEGQMVEPFETWCFDESRQVGDYGLVQTSYGYHVMYYVGSTPIWQYYAESDWTSEQSNLLIATLSENHPMDVDYSAIKLGYIDLGA